MTRLAFLPFALVAIAACTSSTTGTGGGKPTIVDDSNEAETGPGGAPVEHDAPLGAKCHCFDYGDCCAEGAFCYATDYCSVKTATGCYTEGTCRRKLGPHEECKDPRECAQPGSVCGGDGYGCFVPAD